jgi:hypothetical protein
MIGIIMGIVNTIIDKPSKKHPRKRYIRYMSRRTPNDGKPKEVTQLANLEGTPKIPNVPAIILAPIMMNRSIVLVLIAPNKDALRTDRVILLYARVNIRARLAPTAAASVGVITPKYIPPSIMIIIIIIGHMPTTAMNLFFRDTCI